MWVNKWPRCFTLLQDPNPFHQTIPCNVMLLSWEQIFFSPYLKTTQNFKQVIGVYPFLSQPWMCRQCVCHLAQFKSYSQPPKYSTMGCGDNQTDPFPPKCRPLCNLGQQICFGHTWEHKPSCWMPRTITHQSHKSLRLSTIIMDFLVLRGALTLWRLLLLLLLWSLQVQWRLCVVVGKGLRVERIHQALRLKWVRICHTKVALWCIILWGVIEANLSK